MQESQAFSRQSFVSAALIAGLVCGVVVAIVVAGVAVFLVYRRSSAAPAEAPVTPSKPVNVA